MRRILGSIVFRRGFAPDSRIPPPRRRTHLEFPRRSRKLSRNRSNFKKAAARRSYFEASPLSIPVPFISLTDAGNRGRFRAETLIVRSFSTSDAWRNSSRLIGVNNYLENNFLNEHVSIYVNIIYIDII